MVGRAARMRVSSVMAPASSSGTLKSTRTSTRLPLSSSAERLARDRFAMGYGITELPGEISPRVSQPLPASDSPLPSALAGRRWDPQTEATGSHLPSRISPHV